MNFFSTLSFADAIAISWSLFILLGVLWVIASISNVRISNYLYYYEMKDGDLVTTDMTHCITIR